MKSTFPEYIYNTRIFCFSKAFLFIVIRRNEHPNALDF